MLCWLNVKSNLVIYNDFVDDLFRVLTLRDDIYNLRIVYWYTYGSWLAYPLSLNTSLSMRQFVLFHSLQQVLSTMYLIGKS